MNMPLVQFDHVKKLYGRKLILEIPDLTWDSGVHFVMGPNGSGKSTLLKILGGLIPYLGTIMLDATIDPRKHRQQHRQWVNYCEAEPEFPGFLRGEYLIDMYREHKKGSLDQIDRTKEILGIGDYITQKIDAYSSGMKKKLALLLAFIGTPGLILLDEPFNTLDPQARRALVQLMAEYAQQGVSFVLASHHAGFSQDLPIHGLWQVEGTQVLPISEAVANSWMGQGLEANN